MWTRNTWKQQQKQRKHQKREDESLRLNTAYLKMLEYSDRDHQLVCRELEKLHPHLKKLQSFGSGAHSFAYQVGWTIAAGVALGLIVAMLMAIFS